MRLMLSAMLQALVDAEATSVIGAAPHERSDDRITHRNGTRPKTVLTDAAGKVDIEVPRDRAGTFEPVIVKKRQRRLNDVDAIAIS